MAIWALKDKTIAPASRKSLRFPSSKPQTKQRLARGDKRPQVAALQGAEYLPRDLVDIRYDPPNKDTPNRRGPAQIASIQESERNVTVRFQNKTLDHKQQEMRVHVPYLVYLSTILGHKKNNFVSSSGTRRTCRRRSSQSGSCLNPVDGTLHLVLGHTMDVGS